ncbi:MAG: hypothetical protein ONB07_09645 [candidate division KSB1 bacterium]|nr:hypothetical protein [candidate division KSB1 bacterium]MDZ7394087.1 hypothetical protein [candidate division KSB1 bacterium]
MQATKQRSKELTAPVTTQGPLDPPDVAGPVTSNDRPHAEQRLKAVEAALEKVLSKDSMSLLETFEQEGGE